MCYRPLVRSVGNDAGESCAESGVASAANAVFPAGGPVRDPDLREGWPVYLATPGAGFPYTPTLYDADGDGADEIFLFAVKALEREVGEEHFVHVLITYLPVPPHVGEMKTKPTQQAIRMLSEHGIFPDFIVCRAEQIVDEVRKRKIQVGANVPIDHIISEPDKKTLYDIPLSLEKEGLGEKLLKKLLN